MARILVDALVGIDADLAGERELDGPPRRQPVAEQVAGEQLAQPDLHRLVQPVLRHVENEEAAGDVEEDESLLSEGSQVLCARAS